MYALDCCSVSAGAAVAFRSDAPPALTALALVSMATRQSCTSSPRVAWTAFDRSPKFAQQRIADLALSEFSLIAHAHNLPSVVHVLQVSVAIQKF